MNPPPPAAGMPRGLINAYLFQIFNSSSWSIILGTPMLLFLKSMDASAVTLGVAVAMTPLFAALQIPAAGFVEKVGYKNFVVRGWASRSIFILGIAIVAILPHRVSPDLRITLTLLMMACFAAARGISICGLMPWITQIIPEPLRGAFISRDMMCTHLALTGTMLLSSACVSVFPTIHTFAALFLLSYICALFSLVFLRRVPDVQAVSKEVQAVRPPGAQVRPPWKEMLLFPPFLKFVLFNVALNFFISALGVIWVPFMKDGLHKSGSLILGLSAYSSIICALVSRGTGPIIDRTGSRPLLAFSSVLILISQVGWLLTATGTLPSHTWVLLLLVPIGSAGYTILGLSCTRLLMGLVPALGRSHFFAISSVAVSLTMGLMPIIWGFTLDSLTRHLGSGFIFLPGWTWNPYSLFYAVIITGTLASQFLRRRLDEPRSMSTEEFMHILIQSPIRLAGRVLSPLRNFQLPGGG
ncbi:MAG: MFS transporter [bacterium]